jgi:hypothetical protein
LRLFCEFGFATASKRGYGAADSFNVRIQRRGQIDGRLWMLPGSVRHAGGIATEQREYLHLEGLARETERAGITH